MRDGVLSGAGMVFGLGLDRIDPRAEAAIPPIPKIRNNPINRPRTASISHGLRESTSRPYGIFEREKSHGIEFAGFKS